MFSFARAALFMKPESQGRDCVHLSVICGTLLMPPCHMPFYLAAHQPPKKPVCLHHRSAGTRCLAKCLLVSPCLHITGGVGARSVV